MENRPIYTGRLEDLIRIMLQVEDSPEGCYLLYAPDAVAKSKYANLDIDTHCAVAFLSNEEDDNFVPDEIKGMLSIGIVSELASAIEVTRDKKPNASSLELVNAINHYINYDA